MAVSWGWSEGILPVAGALLLAGCVASAESSGGGYAAPASQGGGEPTGAGVQLVDVDVNQVFETPQGGQGVGVFTEYAAGGHWTVQWTCDTSLSGQPCDFQIGISVATGSITNADGQLAESGDQVAQPGPGQVSVTTNTTTGLDGITFDTTPGAIITLSAQVNGQSSGAILFFVQDGKVNGGYQGALSDPLMLEPAGP